MDLLSFALRLLAYIFLSQKINFLYSELVTLRKRYRHNLAHRLPSSLLTALVVGEDRRFFLHGGVDAIALLRALWQRLCYNRLQGASTIEQQLVRTVTRRYELTIRRKIREMLLASCIPKILTKTEILGIYLMIAHFGWSMQGIVRASKTLGYSLESIRIKEAASLVARLKYPESPCQSREWKVLIERRALWISNTINSNRNSFVSTKIRTQDGETVYNI